MKVILMVALVIFQVFLGSFSDGSHPLGNEVVLENARSTSDTYPIFIDSVWAGHRVGFALLTEGSRQYVAYYNSDRLMTVGQRNLGEHSFEIYNLPAKQRTHRAGTSTMLGWDSHNYVTIAIDSAGFLHLSGNMHVNGLTYFRSDKPYDISTLRQIDAMVGTLEQRCTYPRFIKRNDGALLFKYRDGGSGNGSEIYNLYQTKTKQWHRLHSPLIDGAGLMNAYTSNPILGPDQWYHLYWVWRDTPDCETNHDLSYMKSPDLENWYDVRGSKIETPATFQRETLIVDPIPSGGGIINLAAKLSFDENHAPIFVYQKYGPQGNLQLFSAIRREDQWDIKQLTNWDYRWEFSGRGSINNEFILHDFSSQVDGTFQIKYDHIKYGQQVVELSARLEPINIRNHQKTEEVTFPIQGTFPGLEVRTAKDLNSSEGGQAEFILKWESLPANRDKPRPKPWPPASALLLYKTAEATNHSKNIQEKIGLNSIADLHQQFPEYIDQIFHTLNLDLPELSEVNKFYRKGDLVSASNALLSYYKQDEIVNERKSKTLGASLPIGSTADEIVDNWIAIQGQIGKLPRLPNGRLDWHYTGPKNDQEWAWGVNRHFHIRTLLDAFRASSDDKFVKVINEHI